MRAALLGALAALLVTAAPASARITGFYTPSRNIGCAYLKFEKFRELRCDMRATDDAPPPRPASCELEWGYSFGMTARGRARRLCVSDTPLSPEFPVLRYGHTRKLGAFTCRSKRSHLRCTNRAGHGFALSRARQRLF
jgi:hypothetical protein